MKITMFLNILFIVLNGCNSENSVQKETQKRILTHKQFIYNISFEGIVIDKMYCNECNFNKYQIKIKSDNIINEKIEFGNLSFPPYYWISGRNEIILSVNKKLYDATQKEFQVKKIVNSTRLFINNKDYKLLNQKKYEWIPR
jgi:PBP1b-binding outer membrane lipoprotein LpoB